MDRYDVEVQWLITEFCNFDCPYCWLQDAPKVNRFIGNKDIRKIIDGFNNQGIRWLIHMTGGEPFFYPNFLQLCQELTKKHYISINTNLTHRDVLLFSEIINPERVEFLHTSLHITQRNRKEGFEGFIKNYKTFKKAGFNIFVSYLMYPALFDRYKRDYAYFKSRGIILHPKVFWGDYFGIFDLKSIKKMRYISKLKPYFRKYYPDAYSAKQKKLFKDYADKSVQDEISLYAKHPSEGSRTVDLALDKKWVDGLLSYKGKRCSAGRNVVRMEKDGEVYRCIDETQYYLGNMFTGRLKFLKEDLICNARICSCPYVGMRYILQDENSSNEHANN